MTKYTEYLNKAQIKIFDDNGAFFAFSTKQLNENRIEGVKYVSIGAGLICPKDNVSALKKALQDVYKEAISLDMGENSIKDIIWRELANFECQITVDYTDVIKALNQYPITANQIEEEWSAYMTNCIENDYF